MGGEVRYGSDFSVYFVAAAPVFAAAAEFSFMMIRSCHRRCRRSRHITAAAASSVAFAMPDLPLPFVDTARLPP